MTRIAIGIGSNLGDRRRAIAFAAERLRPYITDLTLSEIIETDPEGERLADQPLYLNAVAVGDTALDARETLEALLAIEQAFGRERPFAGAPRTLDLDLLLFGDQILNDADLQVPHPRFRERFFVLGPLAQIAPELVDPVTGLRVGQLLQRLLRDASR
jgi:2-amino-4-hydroxy-6-hydroxymethyldihydropteridine diphosphokinase